VSCSIPVKTRKVAAVVSATLIQEAVAMDALEAPTEVVAVPVITITTATSEAKKLALTIPTDLIPGGTVKKTPRVLLIELSTPTAAATITVVEEMEAAEVAVDAISTVTTAGIKEITTTTAGIKATTIVIPTITFNKIKSIKEIITTTAITTVITTTAITTVIPTMEITIEIIPTTEITTIKETTPTTTLKKTTIGWTAFSGDPRTRMMMQLSKKTVSHHYPAQIHQSKWIKYPSLSFSLAMPKVIKLTSLYSVSSIQAPHRVGSRRKASPQDVMEQQLPK
jgi:hypothetical protein